MIKLKTFPGVDNSSRSLIALDSMIRMNPVFVLRPRTFITEEVRLIFQDWEKIKLDVLRGIKWELIFIDSICIMNWRKSVK